MYPVHPEAPVDRPYVSRRPSTASRTPEPPKTRRRDEHESRIRATDLLDQQLWCFGTDIRHPAQLLLRHGFIRISPPVGEKCSSAYRLDLPRHGHVLLRGFGIFYGEEGVGGVFIAREDFRPRLTPGSHLAILPWWPDALPRLRAPAPDEVRAWQYMTQVLVGWLQLYESWVIQAVGPDHRLAAVERWGSKRRPTVPGTSMRWAWSWVEKQLQTHPEHFWCDDSDDV